MSKLFTAAGAAKTPTPSVMAVSIEEMSSDMIDLADSASAINENIDTVTTGLASLESLDDMAGYKAKMIAEEKTMDADAAVGFSIALESVCANLDYPLDMIETVSLEDFDKDSALATKLSMEEDKNIFAKIMDAIMKVIEKIVAKLKAFGVSVIRKLALINTMANNAIDKAKKADKDGYVAKEKEFKSEGLVKKYAIILAASGSKTTVTKDVVLKGMTCAAAADKGAVDGFTKDLDDSKDLGEVINGWARNAMDSKVKDYVAKESDSEGDVSAMSVYGSKATCIVTKTKGDDTTYSVVTETVETGVDAEDNKVETIALGDVKAIVKSVLDSNKAIDKEIDSEEKFFSKFLKAIQDGKKNAKTDAEKKADAKAARTMSSAFAQVSKGSSARRMNTLKAALAGVSFVNACIAQYEEA